MDITRLAIRYNRFTIVALVLIALSGLISYLSLPRAKDPDVTFRLARITTLFPGASPERVEELITEKVEDAVQSLSELDYVSSTSKTGVSVVMVSIQQKYFDLQPIWDKMRNEVDDIRPLLPEGVIGPIVDDNFGDVFGVVLGITGEGIDYATLEDIADEVRDYILLIDQVAKVELIGVQEERIFVEYNSERMTQLGISPSQLNAILAERNIVIPGGNVNLGVEELNIEPSGNFESVEDLKQTVIALPGRQSVTYLGDIVNIRRGYIDPPENLVRVNGKPGIGVSVSLRDGENILAMGQSIEELLDRLPEQYPHGVEFHTISYEPDEVRHKVDDFVGNVMQSIGVVLMVMLVALGIRTGFIVAALIPTAMLGSLVVMSMTGIGLNQISLAALIISLGLLVDNAIVMTESIVVKMNDGMEPEEAAAASARELRMALLTSSLTTSAAFLPLFLAENDVAEYTRALFLVVTITLLISWLLSLTMTPLLVVRYLAKSARQIADSGGTEAVLRNSPFYRIYRRILVPTLRFRYLTIAGIFGVLMSSCVGAGLVPESFFPNDETNRIYVTMRLPPGTPVTHTSKVVARVEQYMQDELMVSEEREHGIVTWGTFIGVGAPRFSGVYAPEAPAPEYAFILISLNTIDQAIAGHLALMLENYTFAEFPDLDAEVRVPTTGPPVPSPIEIRISGPEVDQLYSIAADVTAKLQTLYGPKNIRDDWGPQTKKVVVDVDPARAFRAGVTNRDIAMSLRANFRGITVSEYREEETSIPIVMRAKSGLATNISELESTAIYSQLTGRNIPLKQVADARVVWESSQPRRRDRAPTISVLARIEQDVTEVEIYAQIQPWLDEQMKTWGFGYRYELGGTTESSVKANNAIGAKFPIGFMVILLLLVAQFNSIRNTFIVLLTVPMAFIGVVVGLIAAKSFFGFMTTVGLISLFGIVINNAIVLIERIKFEILENGRAPTDAIVEAAQRRARPILLTTATTVGGLMPLWIGGGALWEPMTVTLIFGLIFSTILTLIVVPSLYAAFHRISFARYQYRAAPPQRRSGTAVERADSMGDYSESAVNWLVTGQDMPALQERERKRK